MSEITQSLNPQGYNYGGDPQNTNPFWDDTNDGGGVFIPALTQTTNGYVLSWTNNAGLPNPDPVTITNGEDGTPGINGTDGTNGTDGATFTPHMTATSGGYSLSWTNDKGLPNPDAVIITNGVNGTNGINGQDGADGVTPNITAAATVDNTAGTPGCTVVKTGTDAAPTFTFNFTHIRGEKGDTGEQGVPGQDGADGATPQITATATVDNTVGTPSVTVTKTGTDAEPNFAFAFSNIKGQPGTPGKYRYSNGTLANLFTYMAQYSSKFGMIELEDNEQMPEVSYYLMSRFWRKSNDSGMTPATLDTSVTSILFKTRVYGCSEAGNTFNFRKGIRFLVTFDSLAQSGDNYVFTYRFSPCSPYYVKSDLIPVEEITPNIDYIRAMPLWELNYGRAVITLDASFKFVSSDIKIRYVPVCSDIKTLDSDVLGFNSPLAAAVEEKYTETNGNYILDESLMLNYKFMGTGYVAEPGTYGALKYIDAPMDALNAFAFWGV